MFEFIHAGANSWLNFACECFLAVGNELLKCTDTFHPPLCGYASACIWNQKLNKALLKMPFPLSGCTLCARSKWGEVSSVADSNLWILHHLCAAQPIVSVHIACVSHPADLVCEGCLVIVLALISDSWVYLLLRVCSCQVPLNCSLSLFWDSKWVVRTPLFLSRVEKQFCIYV